MSEVPPAEAPTSAPVSAPSRKPTEHLIYVLSLPERALRTSTGLLGGVLRESASLLVPQSFQNSRTYTVMVRQMLDFMVHNVGGVAQGETASSVADIDHYVARKAIGNFVDMASLVTLHVSPLMLLAAVSDLAHGSQVYLRELADELKAQGVIAQSSRIEHVNDLLSAVSDASAATGKMFNTPPLSADALRQTIDEAKAAVRGADRAHLPEAAEVERMWEEMREISRREGVSLLAVSGAATMHALGKIGTIGRGAFSGVKVAGTLFDTHVLEHYSRALQDIRQRGLYQTLSETSLPYIEAVWTNFHPTRSTLTQDVLSGRLLGNTWRAVRGWLGGRRDRDPAEEEAQQTPSV